MNNKDNCPYSWEERGYEDAGAGCHIYVELRYRCRLLPPFRFLIRWPRGKNHENVEMVLRKYFEKRGYIVLQCRNIDIPEEVSQYIVPPQCLEQTYTLMDDMRDIFTPPFEPLKTRWKKVIRDTWKRFAMIFKPYFCK